MKTRRSRQAALDGIAGDALGVALIVSEMEWGSATPGVEIRRELSEPPGEAILPAKAILVE